MGENGSGKSTLIKMLSGAYQPTEGMLLRSGAPVALASPAEAQEAGVATVFQEFSVVPTLTVAENIFLGRWPTRHGSVDWVTMRSRARDALAAMDVADRRRCGAGQAVRRRTAAGGDRQGPAGRRLHADPGRTYHGAGIVGDHEAARLAETTAKPRGGHPLCFASPGRGGGACGQGDDPQGRAGCCERRPGEHLDPLHRPEDGRRRWLPLPEGADPARRRAAQRRKSGDAKSHRRRVVRRAPRRGLRNRRGARLRADGGGPGSVRRG